MDMRIPRLNIKILLGSSPLKSRILVRRLAVSEAWRGSPLGRAAARPHPLTSAGRHLLWLIYNILQ